MNETQELEFLKQEYNDTQEAIAQVAQMVGIDPENWDNDSCPNNSDMLKEIIQHMEEIDKEIDEEALKSPDLTVKGAFELAFGKIPEGATCHVLYYSWLAKYYPAIVDPSRCEDFKDDEIFGTTFGRGGTFIGRDAEWRDWFQQGLSRVDISDRPASAFRGFFGDAYDAVLDSALPQVVRASVEGSKS